MIRTVVVFTFCAVLSCLWLGIADAQFSNGHDCSSISQSMEALSKVVECLQAEVKLQSSVLSSLVSKEQLESSLLSNLATKSDMQMHETLFRNLEVKAAMHDNSLSNLQATVDEIKNLLLNSKGKDEEPVACISNFEAKANIQTVMVNGVGANSENQTSLFNNLMTKKEMQANNLTNMETNVTAISDTVKTLTEGIQNMTTASKPLVEGIIAGTSIGVVVIPLASREQRAISSSTTSGVAFNWHTQKVYWIETKVGIKIADLDGISVDLLIADTSELCGLALDQITGNIYYGVQAPNARIRVCDSMGKKCVTVASAVNIVGNDICQIALFPSEGLMFWSSPGDKKSAIRANMDGNNGTVIISDEIDSLYLDEFTEKLYWANYNGKSIGHSDLNGNNRNVLLNTTINPFDVAVDGDKLYFGGSSPQGVYSLTSYREVSSIANTTGHVYHLALYGRNQVSSRSNPCENSPCANLCVLTRVSYACL